MLKRNLGFVFLPVSVYSEEKNLSIIQPNIDNFVMKFNLCYHSKIYVIYLFSSKCIKFSKDVIFVSSYTVS